MRSLAPTPQRCASASRRELTPHQAETTWEPASPTPDNDPLSEAVSPVGVTPQRRRIGLFGCGDVGEPLADVEDVLGSREGDHVRGVGGASSSHMTGVSSRAPIGEVAFSGARKWAPRRPAVTASA